MEIMVGRWNINESLLLLSIIKPKDIVICWNILFCYTANNSKVKLIIL